MVEDVVAYIKRLAERSRDEFKSAARPKAEHRCSICGGTWTDYKEHMKVCKGGK